jgi:hypothetical protein
MPMGPHGRYATFTRMVTHSMPIDLSAATLADLYPDEPEAKPKPESAAPLTRRDFGDEVARRAIADLKAGRAADMPSAIRGVLARDQFLKNGYVNS